MAYAYKVTRVTLFGTMFSGGEIWSTGFYVGAVSADAAIPTDAAATAVKTAWQTFFTATTSSIAPSFKCDGVKLARLGTDGKTELDHVVTSYYGTAISGAGASGQLPPQIALVATLIGDSGKGLGGKGRMYLPGVNTLCDTTGHLTGTAHTSIATNLKTFLDAVNGSIDVNGSVINASQGRLTGGGVAPLNRLVSSIRVGNVYDTQRRRRNALVEAYSTQTITP